MDKPVFKILLFASLASAIVCLLFVFLGWQWNTFDANTHVFLGSHYSNDFFSLWNDKWYGGFSIAHYPPLLHQLIAALALFVGLKASYSLLLVLIYFLLPSSIYLFARLWQGKRRAVYAAFLAVFLSSISLTVFRNGQITTMWSLPFSMYSLAYFVLWHRAGKKIYFLISFLAALIVVFSHHFTGILIFPVFFAVNVFYKFRKHTMRRIFLKHLLCFGLLLLAFDFIVLYPYWNLQLFVKKSAESIYHLSRTNYLKDFRAFLVFCFLPYLTYIPFIPFLFVFSLGKRYRFLLLVFTFSFLVSLGDTFTFSRRILGRLFYIITLDRISLWATIFALPIASSILYSLRKEWRFHFYVLCVLILAAFVLCQSSSFWLPHQEYRGSIEETVDFINNTVKDNARYITLGLGDRISNISYLTETETLDGNLHASRELDILNKYPIEKIDNTKYFGEQGRAALFEILEDSEAYDLNYVFCFSEYYIPFLKKTGWTLEKNIGKKSRECSVWTKGRPDGIKTIVNAREGSLYNKMLWGLVPIGVFALFCVIFSFKVFFMRLI
ncbi:MAG: hypothetical protein JW728_00025 [Candidatus Aureabacteria bacterium]|nr:hypothetical protein [Candidatus Auribacterota bacterium]